jgi:ABC-type phosphate/phosphonate transport system substrate-binding protein
VVVRKGLSRERAEALQQSLLALNGGPRRDLLRNLYNVDGYVPVTHETYAEVERLAREYGFIEGGE